MASSRPASAFILLLAVASILPAQSRTGNRVEKMRRWNARVDGASAVELEARATALVEWMREDPAGAMAAALPESTIARIRIARPDAAQWLEEWGEWQGEADRLIQDDRIAGVSRQFLRLRLPDGALDVELADPEAISNLQCGDRIRVQGIRLNGSIAGSVRAVTRSPAIGTCLTTGDQKVAILMLNFPGNSLPAGISAATLQASLNGSGKSVDGYFREASYGKTTASGAVFGPFNLAQSYACGSDALRVAAIAAADSTVDFTAYTRIVLVHPGDCGIGTYGCVANTSASKGNFSASIVWLGSPASGDDTTATLIHELGHNLGIGHANSLSFGSQPLGSLGTAGTESEYGDGFSLMGSVNRYNGTYIFGHYAAPHKSALGWFSAGNLQQVETSGSYSLAPYESVTSSPQVLRIRRGNGNDRWLWVEYRQALGYDATFSAYSSQVFSGALIHYENPAETTNPSITRLVNFKAATSPNSFTQPALAAGQSWSDPYTELSLQVVSATVNGLAINVNYDSPCATLTPASATYSAAATTGSATISAPAGCAWSVISNDSWITVTSAANGTGSGTVTFSIAANATPNSRIGGISIARQTFRVTQSSTNNPPTPVSVAPAGGTLSPGTDYAITAVFTDLDGANTIDTARLWFTSGTAQVNACIVEYRRTNSQLALYTDNGNAWNSFSIGGNSTLTNSQCQINVASSTRTVSGATLTLTLNVRFLAPFVGVRSIYGESTDLPAGDSGPILLGAVTIGLSNQTPTPGLMAPTAGSAAAQTLAFTFTDPNGWQDLDVVNILINNFLDGRFGCYLAYSRPLNVLYLVNDAGTALLPGMVMNGSGSLTNSQCTITGQGSTAQGAGNTLTLSLNISFPPAFGGAKVFYAAARDAQNNSGWKAVGTWSVPGQASGTVSAGTATPASGTSATQTFSLTFSSSAGWQTLGVLNILVNDALDGRFGCYLAYSRPANVLYLVNDAGTALLPGLVLNGSGTLSNSQCSINGVGASASGSGNVLTLTLPITFNPSFSGNRILYLAARDVNETNSGWQARGVWVVP